MTFAIETKELGRIYKIRGGKKGKKKKVKTEEKELVALNNFNIEIERGELFGLLGPNGAGKTTLIKILTTLLAPSSGVAKVAGYDVSKDPEQIRPRINMVSGGESSGYGLLTVRENLWMFAQFYGIPSKIANKRIKELLEIVGLGDRLNTKSSDLSTGLRQKMNIVRGFMTDPEVLFLDEPTLGLDVGASLDVRRFIESWMEDYPQNTILLTTHYMVEAEELCNRVAVINKGQILACDSPSNLKRSLQRDAIFKMEVSPLNGASEKVFAALPGVRKVTHNAKDGFSHLEFILEEEGVLGAVVTEMNTLEINILNLEKRAPTLEDVFVELVGKSMEAVESVTNDKN